MIDEQDSGILSPWAGVDVSVVSDRAWISAALRVEVALARAQAHLGIIPLDAAETIADVANGLQIDPRSLAVSVHDTSNLAIGLVQELQRAVEAAVPGTGDLVHLGATSQDILDSATMLVAQDALLGLEVLFDEIRAALAHMIERHGHLPMAGRTVSQHAVPMTFGVKVSTWLNAVIDAEEQIQRLIERGLPLSLAGASGTLAAFIAYETQSTGADARAFRLVETVAHDLGLNAHYQPWHTVRTPIADLAGCLSVTSGVLGKIAADVHVLSRTEIGEVSEGAGEGVGVSSSMPQKRNPVRAVAVLAASRQVPAHTAVLHHAITAEDERSVGAWQSEWQPLRDAFRLVIGSATNIADLVRGLEVNGERMLANLELTGPGILAERVNVALTPLLGRLEAKSLLRTIMLSRHRDLSTIATSLRAALDERGISLPDEELARLADPRTYLGASSEIARRTLERNAAMD